ncbi:polyketide synthase [Hypoxylon sp. FL0543]|nr:polyketide synthase [Hypoxylon sp. FL0543]
MNGPSPGQKLPAEGDDPICIIGIGCRLPPDIRSPSALWDFICQKRSAQGAVPPERFNVNGFHSTDGMPRAGVMDGNGGYFLQEDVRQFDNSFFGINELEATYMDPQQRKLLEVVYECLEDAGMPLDRVSGTNTGVYVGNFTIDFQSTQTRDPDYLHRYHATGIATALMANRISHAFNLQGPSFTLDTACSSSLYCLHNAVLALRAGDCDGAIVASANIIGGPEQHLATVKAGVISPSSTCRTFDASADGYGRGEAVNAIYLKRLSLAIRDGDKIRGIVRGTAVNSDGRTPGITMPAAALQEVVIRKAYSSAGLDPADTDYVECHGTGTAVGDPIEVSSIARCFAARHGSPLRIGGCKPNFGHSEAASALTSVIKVLLAFEKGQIPPTRGIKKLNPKLQFDSSKMKIITELEEWPRAIRRASVNAFGFGGANGHVILESRDSYIRSSVQVALNGYAQRPNHLILPVSASSVSSMKARMEHVSKAVEACEADSTDLDALAYTLAERRSHLKIRNYLLARVEANKVEFDVERSVGPLPFGFIFTGQGAQYPEMAKSLIEESPSFLTTIRTLDGVLRRLPPTKIPNWTLEESLLDPPNISQVHHVTRSQPLCTAIQIALVDMLRSWNIQPTATIGHSSGEIAAAYAAGLLTAEQAILVAYFRGYAVSQLQTKGRMIAAGLSIDDAISLIQEKELSCQVCIACVNAPDSVTLSGSLTGIDIIYEELHRQKKFVRKLETDGRAYHSHMMKAIGKLYEELLLACTGEFSGGENGSRITSSVKMYSSVGHSPDELVVLDSGMHLTARYWRENLEQPVQFSSALERLAVGGKIHLIEIGPHRALKGPVERIRNKLKLPPELLPYNSTLVKDTNGERQMMDLAGSLFLHGHPLHWAVINRRPQYRCGLKVLYNLAPYPWDYSRGLLWKEPRASHELRNRRYARHEILGSQQLAGNGIEFQWRNVLQLEEAKWLQDHRVETQIVFPAAGYLAMAIEALAQVRRLHSADAHIIYQFRNVNIMNALVIPEKNQANSKDIELHTSLVREKLSTSSASENWFEFSISSWVEGQPMPHCTGNVRVDILQDLEHPTSFSNTIRVTNTAGYEDSRMEMWYRRLSHNGLCYGPRFQALTNMRVDGNRIRTDTISTTKLIQRGNESPTAKHSGTLYGVHPIVIDACMQAAILGVTAGDPSSLRARLPVFISKCAIRIPRPQSINRELLVHTRSSITGPASMKADCTLWDERDVPVVNIENVSLVTYNGKNIGSSTDSIDIPASQRHPLLQVSWKPDIQRLDSSSEGQIRQYIATFAEIQNPDFAENETSVSIGAILDLAGHKNPRMRVLELGEIKCNCVAEKWLSILDDHTAFPRCRSWSTGRLDEDANIEIENGETGPFDVVLISQLATSMEYWKRAPEKLASLVDPNGIIVTRTSSKASEVLAAAGFNAVDIGKKCLLALRPLNMETLSNRDVILLVNEPSARVLDFTKLLTSFLLGHLRANAVDTASVTDLAEVEITSKLVCISFLEIEKEFFATMNRNEMNLLRRVTDVVTDLIWVTGADMLGVDKNPSLSLANGVSRALMLEQPSLRFSILDVGRAISTGDALIQELTCRNIGKSLISRNDMDDKEFIQVGGVLHVSRFVPHTKFNAIFRQRLEAATQQSGYIQKRKLADVEPARLSLGKTGFLGTLHFQEVCESPSNPPARGFIDVAIRAISINAKDIYTLAGRVDTRAGTIGLEFSGVVKSVGEDVELQPGDRVVVLAPNHLNTTERVPAWSAHKLLDGEEFTVMSTLPVMYCTALYALCDRARLRQGETILIHAGAGAFGIAAITIAQRIGAIVYTTVSTQAKRDFLTRGYGVPEAHIFNSRDVSFASNIAKATGGRGVDVIINSLTGDLMHESWNCIADFGRFIEIGKRELVDAGKLNMRTFLRNATFTAFDLSDLFYSKNEFHRNILSSKMREVLDLYRSKQIKPAPITVFDVGDIVQAYRHFSTKDRIGKIVISLENPMSLIPAVPSKYQTVFDPRKVYLLIGCLGGLGRSLARWMVARGARSFVFLGRSGCDKASAKRLVARLEDAGAEAIVVRGDVADVCAVESAVKACEATGRQIGGVVQAAMGLHEALFSTMTNEAWHTSIRPKWAGTWNLHNSLEGHSLDFFLLTSSISGSVGTATESNYCAANAFLDAFAQWRLQQGKPATSVGLGMISEVGYLHDNPDIEALLLRKGIQPLDEEEFLQVIDLALAASRPGLGSSEFVPSSGHLLTGMEPFRLRKLMSDGWEVDNGVMRDPRSSIVFNALTPDQRSQGPMQGGQTPNAELPAWLKSVPQNISKLLLPEAGSGSLHDAVLGLIRRRFSSLILLPQNEVENYKPLIQYGVDSMIAAEFRTWLWNTFRVDVPFLDIINSNKDLAALSALVERKLLDMEKT